MTEKEKLEIKLDLIETIRSECNIWTTGESKISTAMFNIFHKVHEDILTQLEIINNKQ